MITRSSLIYHLCISTVSLLLIVSAGIVLSSQPLFPALWSVRDPGRVYFVYPGADPRIYIGQKILAINGKSTRDVRSSPYTMYEEKDAAQVEVRLSNGDIQKQTWLLLAPTRRNMLLHGAPLISALICWLISIWIICFNANKYKLSLQLFWLLQFLIVLLAETVIWGFSVISTPLGTLANLTKWWLGANLIKFQMRLVLSENTGKQMAIKYFYRAAILGNAFAACVTVWLTIIEFAAMGELPPEVLASQIWVLFFADLYDALSDLFFIACIVTLIVWLAKEVQFYQDVPQNVRLQTKSLGLLIIGNSLIFSPLFSLTVIPDIVYGLPLLTYHITYACMGLIGLIYVVAILKYKLIAVERFINRSACWIIVTVGLVGFYYMSLLPVTTLAREIMPESSPSYQFWGTLIQVLSLAFGAVLFHPLRNSLQNLTERLLYGSTLPEPVIYGEFTTQISVSNKVETLLKAIEGLMTKQLQHRWVSFVYKKNTDTNGICG